MLRLLRLTALGMTIAVVGFGAGGAAADDERMRLGDRLLNPPTGSAPFAAPGISFTPRQQSVFDLETARLHLSVAPFADHGASRHAAGAPGEVGERLAIGGALDFGAVEVQGALSHRSLRTGRVDEVDAALDVGAFTTRMSYAEISGGDRDVETRYRLGADLETAPGLSIGADIAVSEDAGSDDTDTLGVVRFRLSF